MKYEIFKTSPAYSEVENQIILDINKDPYLFLTMNILEYAAEINCSKSSISRLVKLLNFKSYFEMKLYVQRKIFKANFYFDVDKNTTTTSRLNNIKSYNNYAINETINNLDIKNFKRICDKIYSAKRILLYGVSSSFTPCYELALNLLKIGISAVATKDIHDVIAYLSNFEEDDVVVVFSKSAYWKEISFILDLAKENSFNSILISANKDLVKRTNYLLVLEDMSKNDRITATSSKISQIAIADSIYYELYFRDEIVNKKSLNKILNNLDKWKKYSN